MTERTGAPDVAIERSVRLRALKARLLEVDSPPTRLGRFALERVLGRGAMGVVYLGRDDRLGRAVAIKLLRQDVRDGGARLEGEARALARLTHPNIVAIHEVGEQDDQRFIAMEYVPGENLRTWMSREHPLEARLDVLRQATMGLRAAHAVGLIHRDLKPHNVLVGTDGRVRIVDFGLATAAGVARGATGPGAVGPRSSITATGTCVGTPAYMAPEQLSGGPASTASDQFALCCLGWELVFGGHPFVDRERDDPPAPTGESLRRTLAIGLSADPRARHPDLEAILAACTVRDRPRRRWALVGVASTIAIAAGAWAGVPRRSEPDAVACVPELDSEASRRTMESDLADSLAFPGEPGRSALRTATRELALGRWTDGCARLAGLADDPRVADEAACWHREFCSAPTALPARARCFGGDVEQCRALAIKHEYEYLDSQHALTEGADPDAAASMQLHQAYWTELMDAACDHGDEGSCGALARGLPPTPVGRSK